MSRWGDNATFLGMTEEPMCGPERGYVQIVKLAGRSASQASVT
jgi:hypothetical protein